jgi:hypothetical protein
MLFSSSHICVQSGYDSTPTEAEAPEMEIYKHIITDFLDITHRHVFFFI